MSQYCSQEFLGKHQIGKDLTPWFQVTGELLASLRELEVTAVPDLFWVPARSLRLKRVCNFSHLPE